MSDRSIIVFEGVRKTIKCHKNGQNVDHPITTFGFFRILNSRFLISQIKKIFRKRKNEIRKEKLKSVEKISRLVRDKRERKEWTANNGRIRPVLWAHGGHVQYRGCELCGSERSAKQKEYHEEEGQS